LDVYVEVSTGRGGSGLIVVEESEELGEVWGVGEGLREDVGESR